MASEREISRFRRYIFLWWRTHKRDLPWRRTHDPYRILVSEVMLQQTQVQRALPRYAEFIEAFPTIKDLADASPADVLRIWRGMGYNRRALYLRESAQVIVADYQGKFPQSEKELIQLPGLGIYTARAVLVFAFRHDVAMVDTNIRQIITHFFFGGKPAGEHMIQTVADQLLPKGKSWEWHQALMDYGSIQMKNEKLKMKNRPKRVPFKDSNRFYRGRIVDRLRDGNVSQRILLSDLRRVYKKEGVFLETIVDGLVREGLIGRTKGILHL